MIKFYSYGKISSDVNSRIEENSTARLDKDHVTWIIWEKRSWRIYHCIFIDYRNKKCCLKYWFLVIIKNDGIFCEFFYTIKSMDNFSSFVRKPGRIKLATHKISSKRCRSWILITRTDDIIKQRYIRPIAVHVIE